MANRTVSEAGKVKQPLEIVSLLSGNGTSTLVEFQRKNLPSSYLRFGAENVVVYRTRVSFVIKGIEIPDIDYGLLRYTIAGYLKNTGQSVPSLFTAGEPPPECSVRQSPGKNDTAASRRLLAECYEATYVAAELTCLPRFDFDDVIKKPFLQAVYDASKYLQAMNETYADAQSFTTKFHKDLNVSGLYSAEVKPCFIIPRYMDGDMEGHKLSKAILGEPYYLDG